MKEILLYIQSVFYIFAGINHFWHPKPYLRIMPPWLPDHMLLVKLSGAMEILCGVLLIFPVTRSVGAWTLMVLLVLIFPGNIQMLLNFIRANSPYIWIAALRLPLQILLIYWAYLYTRPLFA